MLETSELIAFVSSSDANRARHFYAETLGLNAMGIWRAPSEARIAWFTDPDGNILSLTQLA